MSRYAKPQVGDYFEVPLHSKDFTTPAQPPACGQVLSLELDAMNSIACAFWPEYQPDIQELLASTPIAVQLVTSDLLRHKEWPIRGASPVSVPMDLRPYEAHRAAKWVGAKVVGSGIVRKLLLAYRGLAEWDSFHDPRYLDTLLLPGMSPPPATKYKSARA